MKRPITAAIIFVSIILVGVSLAGIARPQERSATYPWITVYGSWFLADERDRPDNRLSGPSRRLSYLLSLGNSDPKKSYKFNLSCISGIVRFEVDISNFSDANQRSGSVSIGDIRIDLVSGKTKFENTETTNADLRNGFFEGEVNQSMLEYLRNQKRIDLSIAYKGSNERLEIPANLKSEAVSAFISLCEQASS